MNNDTARLLLALTILMVVVTVPIKRMIDMNNAAYEAGKGMNAITQKYRETSADFARESEKLRRGIQ